MPLKVMISGAAGFIGSHLVDRLIKDGHKICGIDDLSAGKFKNIEKYEYNPSFVFIEKDIQSLGIYDIFKNFKPDIVVHLAAISNVNYSINNVIKSNEVNVSGTVNLLELSAKFKTSKFIFASSAAVYGKNPTILSEDLETKPLSPYGLQKKIGEDYCKLFSNQYNLDTACLRFFNIYGPRQDLSKYCGAIIPSLLSNLENKLPPIIYGDGEQSRDFCYVKDVINAILLTINYTKPLNGEIFNIASGRTVSINNLCQILKMASPQYLPARQGDVKYSEANIVKARTVLGYSPNIFINEGLARTINENR